MDKCKLVYLGIPYSFNPELSFEKANMAAATLMSMGYNVFSPISHSHPISQCMGEDQKNDPLFWLKQDFAILEHCDELCLVVIGEEGERLIEESYGCQREIEFAKERGIKITKIEML